MLWKRYRLSEEKGELKSDRNTTATVTRGTSSTFFIQTKILTNLKKRRKNKILS